MEQLDTEVVETVAGVARLLRRAAELVWMQADAVNRPGFGGGIDPTEGWSHVSTEEASA